MLRHTQRNQSISAQSAAAVDGWGIHPRPLKVNFGHLIRLHSMERRDPAKLAYKLTDRVLHPSVLERVNVSLAAAAVTYTVRGVAKGDATGAKAFP